VDNLKKVTVFIASPGDVADERDLVRKAVERVNRLVAKHQGFLLEAIGWEDIPSGTGNRAQEVINPYVDSADIFVGVLHQRFGSPTGLAESGTEEEFNRIQERWENEDQKPTVSVYFKKVPVDRLEDPGPQLSKVLDFKRRIPGTFYKEFGAENELQEEVENLLSDWVYRQPVAQTETAEDWDQPLNEMHKRLLLELAKSGEVGTSGLAKEMGVTPEDIESAIHHLADRGLVNETSTGAELARSTDAFLAISKHLLEDELEKQYLSTEFYASMLEARLRGILESRQHCQLDEEVHQVVLKILKISPSASRHLLFGDTTLHDNLADQFEDASIRQDHRDQTRALNRDIVLQRTVLNCANDSVFGRASHELDGKNLIAKVVRIGVSAGYEDTRAFTAAVVIPSALARAGEEAIKAGQMVFGQPGFHLPYATALMHLGEFEEALRLFEKELSSDLPNDARKVALNNQGLILMETGKPEQAVQCFEAALRIDANLQEAQANLDLARQKLEESRQEG